MEVMMIILTDNYQSKSVAYKYLITRNGRHTHSIIVPDDFTRKFDLGEKVKYTEHAWK